MLLGCGFFSSRRAAESRLFISRVSPESVPLRGPSEERPLVGWGGGEGEGEERGDARHHYKSTCACAVYFVIRICTKSEHRASAE